MKRSSLFSCLILVTALALTGSADLPVDSTATAVSAPTEASLGSTTCLCVCQGPIWSIEDIRTNGSCEDLVGTSCWSWGPGIYSSCQEDGAPFPF